MAEQASKAREPATVLNEHSPQAQAGARRPRKQTDGIGGYGLAAEEE